jgi:hypothetical protein
VRVRNGNERVTCSLQQILDDALHALAVFATYTADATQRSSLCRSSGAALRFARDTPTRRASASKSTSPDRHSAGRRRAGDHSLSPSRHSHSQSR